MIREIALLDDLGHGCGRGQMVGGEDGAGLITAAEKVMRAELLSDPTRFASVLALR